jgi:hypothetical protein
MRPTPAAALAAALALAVLAAGCAAPKTQSTTPAATGSGTPTGDPSGWAWWGYALRQCEQPMWAPEQPGGDTQEERRAAYMQMARGHYEAKGVQVTGARFTSDGAAYPAVCGAPSGQRVHLNVTGDAAALERDLWTRDTATWYRFTFTQCEQPVWSPAPPTSGDAQDAWVDQARAHYTGKGVRIVDGKSSFTEDPGATVCGQPSNFRVHLQLPPAEDPAPLVADEWEVERSAGQA